MIIYSFITHSGHMSGNDYNKRQAAISRRTTETDITLSFNIDGSGIADIKTGVAFFDHMLTSFTKHGLFDLTIKAAGDLPLGDHHMVEDTGIVLGQAIEKAVGDKKGIERFANTAIPMDESIASVALDLSGRNYLVFTAGFTGDSIGDMNSQMVYHFFESLCSNAGINAHITASGANDHHKSEAIFKAFGVALRHACTMNKRQVSVPSTKGKL